MKRLTGRLSFIAAASATAVTCLVALTATPANAYEAIWPGTTATIAVFGHGWGHGHGLSQYGAKGAATRGATAAQILAFYYPGTTMATQGAGPVRAQISANAGRPIVVSSRAGLYMRDATTHTITSLSTSYSHWRIGYSSGSYLLQYLSGGAWRQWKASPHQMGFVGPSTDRMWFAPSTTVSFANVRSTAYRGELRLVASGSAIITCNVVDMDLYLRGVVPRESPSSWPAAALQSQAIAARSYSSYQRVSHASNSFDVWDTTRDQVYGGYATYSTAASGPAVQEYASSTAAVMATANQVRAYAGRPIFAQFSSSNGGFTSIGSQPYLRAAADPWEKYSGNPYLNWSSSVSVASLRSLSGLKAIDRIYVNRETPTGGHVSTVSFIGTGYSGGAATVNMSGDTVRSYFGWRSDYFGFVVTGATDGGPAGAWPLVGDQIFAGAGSARVINGVSAAQAKYRPSIVLIQREASTTQTGIYDGNTIGAVYRWQGLVGLPKTGIVDARTWQTMAVR